MIELELSTLTGRLRYAGMAPPRHGWRGYRDAGEETGYLVELPVLLHRPVALRRL